MQPQQLQNLDPESRSPVPLASKNILFPPSIDVILSGQGKKQEVRRTHKEAQDNRETGSN